MRFGVLSTAKIGREDVIPAIQKSDHEVLAIASRDGERAEGVASELSIPRAYGSYEELLADDDLDAVYNPLPNALHDEWTRAAADAGRHVLCEKPLTGDGESTIALQEYCREQGVTLMEAFMYRFQPRTERAVEIVADELEGVHAVDAAFKFALRGRPDDIRLDPAMDGGSLMDVGCYAVSAANLFLGEPERVHASTRDSRDCGVDTEMAAVIEYESGALARVASGFDAPLTHTYRVEAENGWLEVDAAFDISPDEQTSLEYEVDGRHAVETFDPVDQYRLEVEHFAECVGAGAEPRVDAEETRTNMQTIDAVYESAETGSTVPVGN